MFWSREEIMRAIDKFLNEELDFGKTKVKAIDVLFVIIISCNVYGDNNIIDNNINDSMYLL